MDMSHEEVSVRTQQASLSRTSVSELVLESSDLRPSTDISSSPATSIFCKRQLLLAGDVLDGAGVW